MTKIRVKGKPRKGGDKLWTDRDGKRIFVGKDYALQNQIDEAREKTRARGCYRECRTCGACANSQRDSSYPYSHDHKNQEHVNCLTCEPFRFHDCHNGFIRGTDQEAEPFTPDMIDLLEKTGGKPLI